MSVALATVVRVAMLGALLTTSQPPVLNPQQEAGVGTNATLATTRLEAAIKDAEAAATATATTSDPASSPGMPSVRHAIVHIGPPKTATTHLQMWLQENEARLRTYGWAWPTLASGAPLPAKGLLFLDETLCEADSALDELRALIGRSAQSSPHLILSSERLGNSAEHSLGGKAPCPDIPHRLLSLLREFGFTTATVVSSLRTPVIEWMRSAYNQVYTGPDATEALFHGLTSSGQLNVSGVDSFSRFVSRLMDGNAPYWGTAGLEAEWRAAGFDFVTIGEEGASIAGLDVTDVFACEILKVECTASGRWPYPMATGAHANERAPTPSTAPAVFAAWKIYDQQRGAGGFCRKAKLLRSADDSATRALLNLSDALEGQPQLLSAVSVRCSNYTSEEHIWREIIQPWLDNTSVLHVPPAQVAAGQLPTYCDVDPELLAATDFFPSWCDSV